MSNRKSNHNSLESMLRDMEVTTDAVPITLNIINKNTHSQLGGSNYNARTTHNNSYNNVNKLLSMLADDEATSTDARTSDMEERLIKKMKGGTGSNKNELEAFFRKYKINSVNGINTKYFINLHGGDPPQSDITEADTPLSQLDSALGPLGPNTTTEVPTETKSYATTDVPTEANSEANSDATTAESQGFSGGAGMNPGFQAFLNLKKKIAEELKISNGPKAAKIAGAVQKEMKAKYTNLNSVEIAEKGLEHFKKNYDKYKKMV
jgi:hypothetical protein